MYIAIIYTKLTSQYLEYSKHKEKLIKQKSLHPTFIIVEYKDNLCSFEFNRDHLCIFCNVCSFKFNKDQSYTYFM